MLPRTFAVAPLAAALIFALPQPVQAKSGQLWSERSNNSAPLAQVPDFRALANRLVPAVVSIQVEQKARVSRRSSSSERGSPFDFFHPFGPDMPQPHGRGIGTGFVIDQSGLILTNNHVVEKADAIRVTFANPDGTERTLEAEVLGTAPHYDVALIKTLENAKAKIAYLGNSSSMEIGDWVMAIGNPFGLSHSVSVGIISAKQRRDISPSGRRGYYDFIQTDASINPGNSGGPLINMRGEVIGINTAINAAGSGIGFAIPINMVKSILPELKAKGKYTRSWIGIRIQPLTEDLAGSLGLNQPAGAFIAEVVPNSPASRAGLQAEDVVVEFDGKKVQDSTDLPLFASMAGVGKKVPIKVWRARKSRDMSVVLEAFPEEEVEVAESPEAKGGELGLTVADLTPDLAREFRIEASRGVIIKELDPSGVAARAGLRPGDIIQRLNGRKVERARDFATAVRKIKSGGYMRIQVDRRGARLFIGMKRP